jgi:uncharacterized protein YbjT (DUF2867 family)
VATFVVAGVTGRVGSVVASELLARGHQVRGIGRDRARVERWSNRGGEFAESVVGSLGDPRLLGHVLRGADGFFVLLPEDPFVADFRASRQSMADAIAMAVRESRVEHVVMLSAVAACVADGNGPAKDLHYLERLVRASAPKSTILRAAWFQENVGSILPAANQGFFPSLMASADAPFPTIATRDVGRIAATLLLSPPPKSEIIDLMGPAYSPRELASALGTALGKAVSVVEVPAVAHVDALMQAGLPRAFAQEVAELYACFNAGMARPEGDRTLSGETTLADVLPDVLGA